MDIHVTCIKVNIQDEETGDVRINVTLRSFL